MVLNRDYVDIGADRDKPIPENRFRTYHLAAKILEKMDDAHYPTMLRTIMNHYDKMIVSPELKGMNEVARGVQEGRRFTLFLSAGETSGQFHLSGELEDDDWVLQEEGVTLKNLPQAIKHSIEVGEQLSRYVDIPLFAEREITSIQHADKLTRLNLDEGLWVHGFPHIVPGFPHIFQI